MIIIMIIMIALRFQKKMGRAFSANHTESGCLPDCHSMKSPTTNHRHRYWYQQDQIPLINDHLDNQSPANHQIRSFSGTATRSPWPNTDVAIRCNRIFLSPHHQQQLMKFVKTEYILIAHMTSTLLYPSLCWNDAEMINTKTQRSSGWAINYILISNGWSTATLYNAENCAGG